MLVFVLYTKTFPYQVGVKSIRYFVNQIGCYLKIIRVLFSPSYRGCCIRILTLDCIIVGIVWIYYKCQWLYQNIYCVNGWYIRDETFRCLMATSTIEMDCEALLNCTNNSIMIPNHILGNLRGYAGCTKLILHVFCYIIPH